MRKVLIITYIFQLFSLMSQAQGVVEKNDSVTTIVQSGHMIGAIDISADQKFALTTDRHTIALWDLEKRRIIRLVSLPNRLVQFHPLNPTWMMVRPVEDYSLNGQGSYYTYNIFTGKRLGVRKAKDINFRNRWMDNFLLEHKNATVTIKSRKSGRVIGVLKSNTRIRTGRIALNQNDSLLMQTGLRPLVWDLKNAKFLCLIPYIDFLKKDTNLYFKDYYTVPLPKSDKFRIERGDFQYGYRTIYEGYFTKNNELLLGGYNANITRWSIDGRLLGTIKTDGAPIFAFSDNGKYRVAATYEGLNMGRVSDKRLKDCKAFNEQSGYKLLYQVSPAFRKDYFVTGGDDLYLLMGKFGKPDFRKKLLFLDIQPMCYDIDDAAQTILLSGELGRLQEVPIDNPANYNWYHTTEFKKSNVDCCLYLDNDWIAAGCSDGVIGFWRRGIQEAQQWSYVHRDEVTDMKLSHDGKWFISADRTGMIRIWDAKKRTPIVDMHYLSSENDYIFITPDNYYKASKGAYEMIHFAKGLQVLSFDQFDLIYNRPDIILQRLGQPKEKTMPYYLAWKKRLQRMGYTEEMLSTEIHAPELKVTNKESIPQSTTRRQVNIDVQASDSKYKLSHLFVSLNGVPVYGKLGKNIGDSASSAYQGQLALSLCQGNNHIEVSCMNEKGVESFREQIEVFCDAAIVKPRLFVASIGVSQYEQGGFNLNYAAKDAADFLSMMENEGKDRFASVEKILLIDEEFSKDSVERLKRFFAQAKRDDVVMLFYAGHGVLSSDMDYYLSTYAMDFDMPQSEGLRYDDFESCLEHTESVHRFCFVDACHSGELDKEDYLTDNVVMKPVGKIAFRNAGNGLRKVKGYGVKQIQTLFNELFVDVRWGVGATVLTSAGGMEVSLEGNDWNNGLFTWCLKKGIQERAADGNGDGEINIHELTDYVSREVNRLSDGLQTPCVRQENRQQNFIIIN